MRLLNTSYFYLLTTLSLLLAGISTGTAQNNWVPEKYYGIPDKDKQTAFFDEFEDNRNKWDLGSIYLEEDIKDGEFQCASLTSYAYSKHRPVAMNQSGNYEVEIRMRYVRGSERNMTGLVFGRDMRGNEYNFLFSPQGSFKIAKYDRGRTYNYQPWKPSKLLYRSSYNSLMVRKVSNKWYFFVNEEMVSEMEAQSLFGNEFGFTVGGSMAVEVDYVRISEIRTVDNIGPQITLLQPQIAGSSKSMKFTERRQIIEGKVYDVSGVNTLSINGHPITVSSEGTFSASLSLPDGFTSIELVAKDRFENSSRKKFYMEYVEATPPVYSSYSNNTPGRSTNSTTGFTQNEGGKNYLLMIGVNRYTHWNQLHNAVKDCKDIAKTLTSYYQFSPDNVVTLFNEEATRENILETLENLQETVNEKDNVLIYYAGHGFYDDYSTLGYWVPVNARLNKIPDFIRNSTIHDYLRTIDSKHTFLVADACYAGSLFATTRGVLNENNKSRWAFTSGDIEKVWDGQPGQNSPFARYLIRYLRENTKDKLPANELIEMVGTMVQRNTAQTPQGSPLKQAGDDGGVFTFRRK